MISKAFAATTKLDNPTPHFSSIASIVNAFVTPVLSIAGIALFVFLIVAGFKFMSSGDDPKAKDAAKGNITSALIGFVIIFASYWIVQILATVLGIDQDILAP